MSTLLIVFNRYFLNGQSVLCFFHYLRRDLGGIFCYGLENCVLWCRKVLFARKLSKADVLYFKEAFLNQFYLLIPQGNWYVANSVYEAPFSFNKVRLCWNCLWFCICEKNKPLDCEPLMNFYFVQLTRGRHLCNRWHGILSTVWYFGLRSFVYLSICIYPNDILFRCMVGELGNLTWMTTFCFTFDCCFVFFRRKWDCFYHTIILLKLKGKVASTFIGDFSWGHVLNVSQERLVNW